VPSEIPSLWTSEMQTALLAPVYTAGKFTVAESLAYFEMNLNDITVYGGPQSWGGFISNIETFSFRNIVPALFSFIHIEDINVLQGRFRTSEMHCNDEDKIAALLEDIILAGKPCMLIYLELHKFLHFFSGHRLSIH
jgi:hypothetical protein